MRQSQKIHIENFGEQKIVPNNDISEAINSPENRIFIRYIRMLMTHTAFKVG